MAFIFSSSHLPETRVRRPDHLEDEDDDEATMQQPMPRAGGVRAFSHLPVRDNPVPSSGPLSTRPATPVGRPRPHVDPDDDQDSGRLPEPDFDHEVGTTPQDHAGDSPWHRPRITAQDLPPQNSEEDQPDSHLNRPARSSRFDDTPPADRSASSPNSSGFTPSAQDIRDAFHSPAPDSPARQAPAQDSRPALTRGRIFEQRSAPESFLMQQMGKGASGTTSQQRLQVSHQVLAAQQQARGANPPAQGGTPAAQQPVPPQAQTQAPAQSGAAMQQNQGTDATRQGAGATPANAGKHPLTVLCEKFAEFPEVVEALKRLYKVPTGRLMIEKLATVADKIHVIQTEQQNAYVDTAGMHLKKGNGISPDTLGHEFQHLGEILFNTPNPFLKVEDPNDLTAYPGSAPFAKEFRAMRIQNQLLLERYQMMQVPPILIPIYYDEKTPFRIPGSLLPWD